MPKNGEQKRKIRLFETLSRKKVVKCQKLPGKKWISVNKFRYKHNVKSWQIIKILFH